MTDISILVGGAAGQGLHTIGSALTRALNRQGLFVFSVQDYYSRVRGGHNFVRIRASDRPVYSYLDRIDVLVALDELTVRVHGDRVARDGMIVTDGASGTDSRTLSLPLADIARSAGGKAVMANSVATGAAWWLLGGDPGVAQDVVGDTFAGRGAEIRDGNIRAFAAGLSKAREFLPKRSQLSSVSGDRLVMTGNEAVALGALAAGCQFVSSYPMTPASSIVEQLAGAPSLVFEQAEDEIAAIHMALGASYCGSRALVATSGGGFSLMVEGLSLAGMTELPLVIVLGQRPGPATGLATRTEQSELLFSLYAGHGEFPRVLLSPATAEQAFWHVARAFNLADRFGVPVIVLTDQHLADAAWSVNRIDPARVEIDRGRWLADHELASPYLRHAVTEDGISPRAFPGQAGQLVIMTGNEHDERGLSTEDPQIRTTMVNKRLARLSGLAQEIEPPLVYGEGPLVLLTWGSTYGACREAVDQLAADGVGARMVHVGQLWPFPAPEVLAAIADRDRLICVEMNATGQLGRLLRQQTGIQPDAAVLKYDGRPMNAEFIVRALDRGGDQPW